MIERLTRELAEAKAEIDAGRQVLTDCWKTSTRVHKDARNSAIEECAKVVDTYGPGMAKLAAAICALVTRG